MTKHICQLYRTAHRSPALPFGSPNLLHKMDFWAFLCLGLKFSSFFFHNSNFIHCTISRTFLPIFSLWQRLFRQVLHVRLHIISLAMAAGSFSGQGGWGMLGLLTFGGGGGAVMQNRESPDFGSPEVGISGPPLSLFWVKMKVICMTHEGYSTFHVWLFHWYRITKKSWIIWYAYQWSCRV